MEILMCEVDKDEKIYRLVSHAIIQLFTINISQVNILNITVKVKAQVWANYLFHIN